MSSLRLAMTALVLAVFAGVVGTHILVSPSVVSADIGGGRVGPRGSTGPTGPTASLTNAELLAYFGNGADGALVLSSGNVVLTRDTFYTTGVISGTGVLETRGFSARFSSTLTLDNCPAGGVVWTSSSLAGGSGSGSTGGSAPAATPITGVWVNAASGKAGGNQSAAGTNGGISTNLAGGQTRASGAGGANEVATAGGAAGNGAGVGQPSVLLGLLTSPFPTAVSTAIGLGFSGYGGYIYGGAGGGRAGTTSGNGGGGGASGAAGGMIPIFARTISRGASTAAGCINASGGNGGNGAAGTAGVGQGGGGGGGAGGGGGVIYLVYGALTGSSAAGALVANGGNGGNSGAAGGASAVDGGSGGGADGGCAYLFDLTAGTSTRTCGTAGVSGTAGTTGGTGKTGGSGGTLSVSF